MEGVILFFAKMREEILVVVTRSATGQNNLFDAETFGGAEDSADVVSRADVV